MMLFNNEMYKKFIVGGVIGKKTKINLNFFKRCF